MDRDWIGHLSWVASSALLQSVRRRFRKMKCVVILLFLIPFLATFPGPAHADDFNYLVAAYNYAIAVKTNFDDAYEYYGDYLSQEIERIGTKITERLAVALEAENMSAEQGRAMSTCADSAAFSFQALLVPVHREFLLLKSEGTQLNQAVNEKLREINIFLTPFDELYYKFTDEMMYVYLHLNEELLPNLLKVVVDLVNGGEATFETMNSCLDQIQE